MPGITFMGFIKTVPTDTGWRACFVEDESVGASGDTPEAAMMWLIEAHADRVLWWMMQHRDNTPQPLDHRPGKSSSGLHPTFSVPLNVRLRGWPAQSSGYMHLKQLAATVGSDEGEEGDICHVVGGGVEVKVNTLDGGLYYDIDLHALWRAAQAAHAEALRVYGRELFDREAASGN